MCCRGICVAASHFRPSNFRGRAFRGPGLRSVRAGANSMVSCRPSVRMHRQVPTARLASTTCSLCTISRRTYTAGPFEHNFAGCPARQSVRSVSGPTHAPVLVTIQGGTIRHNLTLRDQNIHLSHSRRSPQACIASLALLSSLMSETYLKSDHFIGGGSVATIAEAGWKKIFRRRGTNLGCGDAGRVRTHRPRCPRPRA